MTVTTPAQRVSLLLGAWFVLNGVGAFVVNPRFTWGTGGGNIAGLSPLTIAVNGWHALFHLVPGLVGILVARSARGARLWAWGVGLLYGVAGIWGLIDGHSALMLISVERFGSVVHLIEGTVATWAAAKATGWIPRRSRVTGISLFATMAVVAVWLGATEGVFTLWCCGAMQW